MLALASSPAVNNSFVTLSLATHLVSLWTFTGTKLIEELERLTGVTWAASTDDTGGRAGADWIMEYSTSGTELDVRADYFTEKISEWKFAAAEGRGRADQCLTCRL